MTPGIPNPKALKNRAFDNHPGVDRFRVQGFMDFVFWGLGFRARDV